MSVTGTDKNGVDFPILTGPELTSLFANLQTALANQQTTLASVLTAVTDTTPASVAGISTIGTRAYQAGITPLSVTTSNAASAAITATEVTLCNVGANRCFVRAGPVGATATVNDLAIEPGTDRTIRITSGNTINAICASGNTATLNIVPVA